MPTARQVSRITDLIRLEIANLEQEIATLQHQLHQHQQLLAAAEELKVGSEGLRHPPAGPFTGMGIVEAAKIVLRERGPLTTPDLAAVLKEGGLRSKSTRLTPNVYATLANAAKGPRPQFTRTSGGMWALVGERVDETGAVGADLSAEAEG
jgi:hypothetical protein